ncbi:flagellar hook-length control protein FliK [Erwinia pyrifoliae]|uniref:flagellar hook-length control protein FliK n=1 Tax=Erwinia pyrifoliae TaxID=79967 RepID=UPI0001961048|nr:flagellar hook-length control protein FliK [Erwinia pyrifoliae]AUX73503.1 flagellar hook-length control protein FliK [Erwinia pyrifoliae]MCA8876196.1 flagellar hook-length control protein FliK [Erwinia pyrifoliae]UWS28467.1 flagellar hook-length control protein FliK [Erwinia pyrifoliae]CAX54717.1 Flagellar hook-length control protein [Erwinia pyrifoliae Ep1/96]CAY73369.1 Flagellar hook-length control protein FliK [Erwinia pyrifoliae DSM 12163]
MNIDINALLTGEVVGKVKGLRQAAVPAGLFHRIMAEMPDGHPLLPDCAPGDLPETNVAQEISTELAETLCPQQSDEWPPENHIADEDPGALLALPVMPEGWEKSPIWQLQQVVMQNASGSDGGAETLAADEISGSKAHNPLPQLPLSLKLSDRQDGTAPPVLPGVNPLDDKSQPVTAVLRETGLTEVATPADAPAPGAHLDAGVPRQLQAAELAARTAALPAPATAHNSHPVGSAAWQHSLSQQLAIFTRDGVQNAEIRLHPEELGSLQISVRMQQDQAQLHIISEHPQVRQALEAALPQLRSALAESGLQLGQASVSADGSSSTDANAQRGSGGKSAEHGEQGIDDEDNNERLSVTQTALPVSGINTFA